MNENAEETKTQNDRLGVSQIGIDKLQAEANDLNERLMRLTTIQIMRPEQVSDAQMNLVNSQEYYMRLYLEILIKRIVELKR